MDRDQVLRCIEKGLHSRLDRYQAVLESMSTETGKLRRHQRKGTAGSLDEVKVGELKKTLLVRKTSARKLQDMIGNLKKDRRRAFNRLYRVSQMELDNPPRAKEGSFFILPEDFSEILQDVLDARSADEPQAEQTRELGKRARELDQSLTTVDKTTEAANIIKAQRQDASNEQQEAAMEADARAKNLAELESWMIGEAWPFVTMEGDMFQRTRSNVSQVSRGNMHQAMDDNVSNEVKAIPSGREHLNIAINVAIELHANKQKRFIKLARRYYHDLGGYTKDKVDKHQARIEFDQQFYSDRAQAMREAAIVERQYQDLKKRREIEGERKLEDMYSNYGTLSEDGHVSSMGTFHLRAVRRAYALDQPYVEEYLDNIDQDHLLSPTCPPTEPKSANDSDFVARSLNVGNFDTFSRADDHRTAKRIQRWRGEMEVLREEMQSGSAQQA